MDGKLWMVLQGDTQDQNLEATVIQKDLNSHHLYVQTNQRLNVQHVELYTKLGNAPLSHLFVSNAIYQAIFWITFSTPSSNRNTRGSWYGRGRGNNRSNRGHGSRHAVYEADMSDTSKPIVDATNSEVDVVKLLQAYGMVPTEGSELKHRKSEESSY